MGLTIAGKGEGDEVSVLVLDEDPDQSHVEHHPLHQHPHEGHQEEVVQQDGCYLATNLRGRGKTPAILHLNDIIKCTIGGLGMRLSRCRGLGMRLQS